MLNDDEEAQLLERAIDKGWLSRAEMPSVRALKKESSAPARFGMQLDALIDAGVLSVEAVSALVREAASTPSPQTDPIQIGQSPTVPPPVTDISARPDASLSAPQEARPFVSPVPGWESYELLSVLGRGGMGTVYKARDLRLRRFVAIKFLHAEQDSAVQRFLQEARSQARIDHENVCKVYQVGAVFGKPYIAMELVNGLPLHIVAAELRLEEKLCIVRDAALALHAANRLGIVHRDVKPSNILVQRRDNGTWRPVVMDFGLAHDNEATQHLTRSGVVFGTPGYMSPEQARGDTQNIDRRTDVYALGATLFELLTGRTPFESGNQTEILLKVLSDEPPPLRSLDPGLPADLETIVLKCLHKEPAQRYESARSLAEDLQRHLDGEPIQGKRTSFLYRLRRRAQKHRAVVAVAGLALMGLSGLSAYGLQARLAVRREQVHAAARAKLSQELGQTVKEMEWFIRSVHQLPVHDTSYATAFLQARIKKLTLLRHGLGTAGDGLVQYALGHAHVALQDFDLAYQYLEEAQHKGHDTPELRWALARVLGEQYKKRLEAAVLAGDVGFVKAQKKELRKKYIEPAISLLRTSMSDELASPQLLAGLLALYSEQYDEALQKAQEADKQAPWLYEAKLLAGDVHFARGIDQRNQTDYDAANKSFALAVERYQAAAEIGRSDAQVYEAIAESFLQWGDIATNLQRRLSETPLLDRANAYCQKAIAIAPSRSLCYSKSSRAYALLLAVAQALHRPMDDCFEKLVNIASRGLSLNPDDAYIYDSLGNGYHEMGIDSLYRDKNPMEYYKLSTKNFLLGLNRQPTFPVSLTNLGRTYSHELDYLSIISGTVPMEEFESAVQYLRKSYAIDPQYMPAWVNLLTTYTTTIQVVTQTGQSPLTLVDETRKTIQAALAAGVKVGELFLSALKSYRYYEQYLSIKMDNGGLLSAWEHVSALANLAETNLNPNDKLLSQVRVFRALSDAHIILSKGQDPSAVIHAGLSTVSKCFSEAPYLAECYQMASALSLLAADFAALHDRPVGLPLQQAVVDARRAVALYALPEHQAQLARALLRLTEAQAPRLWPASIAEGLKATAAGIKEDASFGELHALRGRFYVLQARTVAAATERRALAAKANEEFTRAVQKNPLLARAYERFIVQAKAMVAPISLK